MKRAIWLLVLTAASGAQTGFERELLEAHNAFRARVGVPPLAWSGKLAATAREWANSLIAKGRFQHRPERRFGENLFEISGARATPREVVADWASESRERDCRTDSFRGACGHYMQMVWGKTREVGCAVARNNRREVWVCNYHPPGNVIGERPFLR